MYITESYQILSQNISNIHITNKKKLWIEYHLQPLITSCSLWVCLKKCIDHIFYIINIHFIYLFYDIFELLNIFLYILIG